MGIHYGPDGVGYSQTGGNEILREVGIGETPFGRGLTIAAITAEVREVNIAKGWRALDGGMCEGQTFGDYIALAHSELSEALEAYRDHRLADGTDEFGPGPCSCAMSEGSMNNCTMHGPEALPKPEGVGSEFADLLIRLVDMADVFGFDLEAEYRRKIAYNRTRAFQHGGRTLADNPPAARMRAEEPVPMMPIDQLAEAIPDDPRGWWTGPEVATFLQRWLALGLPELVMQDATGEVLTLWTKDVGGAAAALDVAMFALPEPQFFIKAGEYEVCVVQAGSREAKDA